MKGTFSIRREVVIDYRNLITDLLSDGLYFFGGYNFDMSYNENEYQSAKDKLGSGSWSIEDIQAQMLLDGCALAFVDLEGEGDNIAELTLSAIEKALWRFLDEQPNDDFILTLERILSGDYDAEDCDTLLQYILFGEVTFG